jgi:hypothetical protein
VRPTSNAIDPTVSGQPWLKRISFTVAITANPREGFGPILTAERIEDHALPTVLTHVHGHAILSAALFIRATFDFGKRGDDLSVAAVVPIADDVLPRFRP